MSSVVKKNIYHKRQKRIKGFPYCTLCETFESIAVKKITTEFTDDTEERVRGVVDFHSGPHLSESFNFHLL